MIYVVHYENLFLPKGVAVAGSKTTWPRLASLEYCKPTVAGDMDITDSMGSASII